MKRTILAFAAVLISTCLLAATQADARGRGGCGSHGGPGYRKANGKCASWRD